MRPVTDTYHGVKVVDPYRWLETDEDPEVKAWSDAENAYARSVPRPAAERRGDSRAGHRDHVGQVAELRQRDVPRRPVLCHQDRSRPSSSRC